MNESPGTKRGRTTGSKDGVPRTPSNLWELCYPGVAKTDATVCSAKVPQMVSDLAATLQHQASWKGTTSLVLSGHAWRYVWAPMPLSPWKHAEDSRVAEGWIVNWLGLVLFNAHARNTPFAAQQELAPTDGTAEIADFEREIAVRPVVDSIQRKFDGLRSVCHVFLGASMDALLWKHAETFRDVAKVIEPPSRDLSERGKERHEEARRVFQAVWNEYRNIMDEKMAGNKKVKRSPKPEVLATWDNTSYRGKPQISRKRILEAVTEQSAKQLAASKDKKLLNRIDRILKKIEETGGPTFV